MASDPFADALKFAPKDPFEAALEINKPRAGTPEQPNVFMQGLGLVGQALQPLQAPQQILFGGVRAAQTGDLGEIGRGAQSALGFLTYGLVAGQARDKAIYGRELLTGAGVTDEKVLRWGGLGLDVLADPSNLLGGAGLAAKGASAAAKAGKAVSTAVRLEVVGEKLLRTAKALDSAVNPLKVGANVLGAVDGIAAPIANALGAVKPAFRAAATQNAARLTSRVLNVELPVGRLPGFQAATGAARASVGELFVPPEILKRVGTADDQTRAAFLENLRKEGQRLERQYGENATATLERMKVASAGLNTGQKTQLDSILARMQDAKSRADFVLARGDLQSLGSAIQRPTFEREALAALDAGIRFDVWSGHNLIAKGLENGPDPEGLRRSFMMLEDADAHIARVLADGGPDAIQTAERLRLQALEGKGAARGPGQLSQNIRDDLGQIQSFRMQIATQAQTVSHEVVRQTALLETRKFLEGEGAIYPALSRGITDGTVNASSVPAAVLARPERVTGFQAGGGWRTITEDQSRALNGVFNAGDVVPDWAHRYLSVASRSGDELPAVLQWGVRNWKAVKLGNPSTIATNVLSGVVQADQYGVNPARLVKGMFAYLTRKPGGPLERELMDSGLSHSTAVERELRGASKEVLEAMNGLKGGTLENFGQVISRFIDEATGANPGALPAGSAIQGAARASTSLIGASTGAAVGGALAGPVGAVVGGVAGAVGLNGRTLLELHSKSEAFIKGSIFAALRSSGQDVATAAEKAENALFDYSARPLWASYVSKTGLDPFNTFRTMSGWRMLVNAHDNPGRMARYYRITNSEDQNPQGDRARELTAADARGADYITHQLPVLAYRDKDGRGYYAPLAKYLPENAVASMFDDANSSNLFGVLPIPPALGAYQAIMSGVGFQGMKTYQGLGDGNLSTALSVDSVEATRRALKVAYQFGAYPWAPGQPNTERLARAIAQSARSSDDHAAAAGLKDGAAFEALLGQGLKFLAEGPFTYGDGALPAGAPSKTGERAPAIPFAALRSVAGVPTYPIQADPSKPGLGMQAVNDVQFQARAISTRYRQLIGRAQRGGAGQAELEALQAKQRQELTVLVEQSRALLGRLQR